MQQILTTDRGLIDIADVNIGETVYAWEGGVQTINTVLAKDTIDQAFMIDIGCPDEWKWYLVNGSIKLFHNQSIYCNGNVTHAFLLQPGDTIYDQDNNPITVSSIVETTEDPVWWRLTIDGNHGYISQDASIHNASRFWVGGGSSANWNATVNTNWSGTSGGANNASVPGSSDTAQFDTNSNSPNTISAIITVGSWTADANYTNTTTVNANITVAGAVTLGANATYAGASTLVCTTTATLTSNAKTWARPMTLQGTSQTYTLADNWTVTGTLTFAGSTAITINGNTFNAGGSLTSSNASIVGTTAIVMNGTGTWSGAGSLKLTLTFNTAGTITWSGTVTYGVNTMTYTAGTMIVTGSTLLTQTNVGSVTYNIGGMSVNNFTFANATTHTLSSDINALGNVNIAATSSNAVINGSTVYVGGNLTNAQTSATTSGTTNFVMNGSGTLNFTNFGSTGSMRNNITINTSGNITIGDVAFNTGTFDHVASGSITVTPGSTLAISLNGTTTINSNGIQWVNATFNQTTAATYTFGSLFTATGTVSVTGAGAPTFNGAGGFTIATLSVQLTAAVNFTMQQGNTYTVTTSFINLRSDGATKVTFRSSDATLQVTFILNYGATCAVGYANATRVNSAGGRTIRTFGSNTLTTTTNWSNFTDLVTVSAPFG